MKATKRSRTAQPKPIQAAKFSRVNAIIQVEDDNDTIESLFGPTEVALPKKHDKHHAHFESINEAKRASRELSKFHGHGLTMK